MSDLVPANVLDRNKPEPLYVQIKYWMLNEIESGRWSVHYKLPAEEDLARALGVNRGTLRQALRELTAAGKLTQIHGKGTFVSSSQLEQPLADDLVTFSENLIDRHIPFETKVLEQAIIVPARRVASLLSIPPDARVFYLKRVRTVHGKPLIMMENYVVLDHCPGIEQLDFTRYRLFEVLEERFRLQLDWGRRTFAARSADDEVIKLLALAPTTPVMYIEQVVYLHTGAPIELSDVWLHGDQFRLSATVKRHGLREVNNLHPYESANFTLSSATWDLPQD